MDIVDFLLARVNEDAAASRRRLSQPLLSKSDLWYEERLLVEAEAKRAVIDVIGAARRAALDSMLQDDDAASSRTAESLQWWDLVLSALALPYTGHPDYQEQWTVH